jgi:hypothetical protein
VKQILNIELHAINRRAYTDFPSRNFTPLRSASKSQSPIPGRDYRHQPQGVYQSGLARVIPANNDCARSEWNYVVAETAKVLEPQLNEHEGLR